MNAAALKLIATDGEIVTDDCRAGYCLCGCGQKTDLATKNDRAKGWVRGEPKRYIRGHYRPLSPGYVIDPESGCWIWQGATNHGGYCHITIGQRMYFAHRVYYERAFGAIPEGLQIDHLCFERRCVNPAHLEAVTPAENVRRRRDLVLTIERAREIRALAGSKTPTELAQSFGVSIAQVYNILRGRTWKEVA